MLRKTGFGLLLTATILLNVSPVRGEITAEQVNAAIRRGTDYLISQQNKDKGNWPEHPGQPGGVTALCTLALINAGVDIKSAPIQRALNYLRAMGNPDRTYATSLQTMVFCAAEPEIDRALIVRNVRWLEDAQISSGDNRGGWRYGASNDPINGDNSNSQFALLALHEAHSVGVQARETTWRHALEYWSNGQKADGSWGYIAGENSTGSMTAAGISSLIIIMDKLPDYQGDAEVIGDRVGCCGKQNDIDAIERGLAWLGKAFQSTSNPGAPGHGYWLYYMYGVERVGRLSGRRFIGRHDWYRAGADVLVNQAHDRLSGYFTGIGRTEDNKEISTSFALLFLAKGRRPVVLAKYRHTDDTDWDLHRRGVHNLTHSLEQRWKRDLTWQTIDARAATVDDLMESPVLFISGQRALNLSQEQKRSLREYVNNGGFIFAEACNGDGCDGEAFDRSFRALMRELFPDTTFRALPPDHPIWYAERKVIPSRERLLWGLDACCRTSVVYCPSNLSCYWELAREGVAKKYSEKVQESVDECLAIGQNVMAYATNRDVKEKLNRPQVTYDDAATDSQTRNTLYVPKLSHGGGSDDAPNALSNLLRVAAHETDLRISSQKRIVAPDNPELFDYPIVFMHGRRDFRFTATQRKALATYLERGGFLFADSICAAPQFAEAFRRELRAMFPDAKLEPIPSTHPLLTQEYRGYDLSTVVLRDPQARGADDPLTARLTKIPPRLEGLEIDGRLAVVFSPYDISCAMENNESLECKGYTKADAAKIGVNVILFALQQ